MWLHSLIKCKMRLHLVLKNMCGWLISVQTLHRSHTIINDRTFFNGQLLCMPQSQSLFADSAKAGRSLPYLKG